MLLGVHNIESTNFADAVVWAPPCSTFTSSTASQRKQPVIFTIWSSSSFLLLLLPCDDCSTWTSVVEEILAFGNRLRSTFCRECTYLKLFLSVNFVCKILWLVWSVMTSSTSETFYKHSVLSCTEQSTLCTMCPKKSVQFHSSTHYKKKLGKTSETCCISIIPAF